MRSGNIQIGGDDILLELFPEPRFNAWAVAEVHILDHRITPNARRDQYEYSTGFANVVNHLGPLARGIATRCRTNSQHRQLLRGANLLEERVRTLLGILRQGAVTQTARATHLDQVEVTLQRMEKILHATALSSDECSELKRRHRNLSIQLARVAKQDKRAASLARLTPQRRHVYEEVFSLIYACASDSRLAKELVQRVLTRLP